MSTVFGYIRFSFFGRNDTRLSRFVMNDEKRFNLLYDPQRMEERFYLFENITLPSIRGQIEKDFKILVVSSVVMPDEYKKRLNAAVADIPQIEVVYSDAAHITDEINPRIADMTSSIKGNKTVHFRLDDDDAICAQMVGLLRINKRFARENEIITFPKGLYLIDHQGKPCLMRKFAPYIAIGWAYVNTPGQVRNPYQGQHNVAFKNLPSMVEPRAWAYIHVAHQSSDTKFKQGQRFQEALEEDPNFDDEKARSEIDGILTKHFPFFTADRLRDIISNAPGKVVEDEKKASTG